jgi:heptaprenyl diphosphate synthase
MVRARYFKHTRAFAHIAGQLLVVRLWLIPHAGLAYLIPIFAAAALFFGIINGLITSALLNNPSKKPQIIKKSSRLG